MCKQLRKLKREVLILLLIYFWLNSPELAIARVKTRVSEGGHNIPEEVIRTRYQKGINNLFQLFIPICDYWIIIDNSQNPYIIVAEGREKQELNIQNQNTWKKLNTISHA